MKRRPTSIAPSALRVCLLASIVGGVLCPAIAAAQSHPLLAYEVPGSSPCPSRGAVEALLPPSHPPVSVEVRRVARGTTESLFTALVRSPDRAERAFVSDTCAHVIDAAFADPVPAPRLDGEGPDEPGRPQARVPLRVANARVEGSPRWGLFAGGLVTLGVSWLVSVAIGLGVAAGNPNDRDGAPAFFVPVIGTVTGTAIIADGGEEGMVVAGTFGSLVQVVGLALMIGGLTADAGRVDKEGWTLRVGPGHMQLRF